MNTFYNTQPKTQVTCKICGNLHTLEYLDAVNGATHLIYRCNAKFNETGKIKHLRTIFVPKINGLDIKHTVRKKDIKSVPVEIPTEQISMF